MNFLDLEDSNIKQKSIMIDEFKFNYQKYNSVAITEECFAYE